MHLMDLALDVKLGVEEAGMVAYRFNTIGVSDGMSMGTTGMCYSLQSRDLIADSVETVMGAQWCAPVSGGTGSLSVSLSIIIVRGHRSNAGLMGWQDEVQQGPDQLTRQPDIRLSGSCHYILGLHLGTSCGECGLWARTCM